MIGPGEIVIVPDPKLFEVCIKKIVHSADGGEDKDIVFLQRIPHLDVDSVIAFVNR